MSVGRITAAALLFTIVALPVTAQPELAQLGPRAAPTAQIQVGTLPVMDTTPTFDAQAATKAYLAKVSGEARAKSDAYYEGGYILQLVDLAYALAIAALLLWLQISTRIRDWVEDRTHSRGYQVMLYGAAYVALTTAAALPLALYEGFFREHAYGLSNQGFTAWLADFGIQFAITLVCAVLFLPVLYAVMRRAR
jgi:STE24 endopeptidase